MHFNIHAYTLFLSTRLKMYIGVPPGKLDDLVRGWLDEDVPSFDFGGVAVGTKVIRAEIRGKAAGIMAGRPFVDAIFKHLNCK